MAKLAATYWLNYVMTLWFLVDKPYLRYVALPFLSVLLFLMILALLT